jgi:predicted phage terminase large subunit-like protein
VLIRPQEGPQEAFLSTPADICIYGGAAGGGKSYGLLLEPLRHVHIPKFSAVIFRRYADEITMEGGLWEVSQDLYPNFGATPVATPIHQYRFQTGSVISFRNFDHEKKKHKFQGAQIPLIEFDELTHFSESMFWYMLSRNRSTCGIKPYMRASTNPDPDSWILPFISWWVDQDTGFPIKERSGVIRWFIRQSGEIIWANSKDDLQRKYPGCHPKSFTFIPSSVFDNKILLDQDPGYLANLNALLDYEQKRLMGGNWFARPTAGEIFKRQYFEILDPVEIPPAQVEVRFWDRAATNPSELNPDPDWSAGIKLRKAIDGKFYIMHASHFRGEPYDVHRAIKNMASQDGRMTTIGLWQDPGSAGKYEVKDYVHHLMGFDVQYYPQTKNKLSYWKPLAVQAKAGNVKMARGEWNESFLRELEGVTDGSQPGHDDQADAAAGAFLLLTDGAPTPIHVPELDRAQLRSLRI